MSRAQRRQEWQAHFRGQLDRPGPESARLPMAHVERHASSQRAIPQGKSRGVRVHIEELVLRGFGRADGDRIADALRSELQEILTANGLPRTWEPGRSFDGGEAVSTGVTSRANARSIGAQVARTIYNVCGDSRQ